MRRPPKLFRAVLGGDLLHVERQNLFVDATAVLERLGDDLPVVERLAWRTLTRPSFQLFDLIAITKQSVVLYKRPSGFFSF
jgi:hypothetical protein